MPHGYLTELAQKDERIRDEDLKKLVDSQLGTQGQLWLFLGGAFFGGILSIAVTRGINWISSFDPFTQTIEWLTVSILAAVLLTTITALTFFSLGRFVFRQKIYLMKDYLRARGIVEKRMEK
ncbi:MAG: hypothetical protein AUF79_09080 [Crenarchaeota archaeon 13_1_20CM_2_51_8]|nr:MAG: hypothetical protein AUF79_09080 [Crenarchaeota archaeon 13_1_20CM_2_51_8]